jgi:Ca2+-binding RTX toxin-like protein
MATIVGTQNNDNVEGTEDEDVIHLFDGDDDAFGFDDDDEIRGGDGDDFLDGEDTFVFFADPNSGDTDRIRDFNVNQDEIELEGEDDEDFDVTKVGTSGREFRIEVEAEGADQVILVRTTARTTVAKLEDQIDNSSPG